MLALSSFRVSYCCFENDPRDPVVPLATDGGMLSHRSIPGAVPNASFLQVIFTDATVVPRYGYLLHDSFIGAYPI